MYEASFGLKRRPFAATPDATCFLSSGPIQAALDELVVCVEQGQGIAVLTAPAGTGKTLLCERMCCELDRRYETILLRHASFMTRRALLQTILCELNHTYHQPTEQELRLELFPAIRALQPDREALVLICDEAHQLNDSLLEELRILADFAESGKPLVRLVLVGQPPLEEKLAQPGLEALNQRIRAQINLSPFDRAASLDYIDYRLTWAGGRTDEVFTPGALELIAQASDGVPRCINQLADHTLLLAFVAEQRPAGEELVREALTDLRQLPLHWNEPMPSGSVPNRTELAKDHWLEAFETSSARSTANQPRSNTDSATYSYEPLEQFEKDVAEDVPVVAHQTNSVEFGTDIEFPISYSPMDFTRQSAERDMMDSDDWRKALELFHPQSSRESKPQNHSVPTGGTTIAQESKARDPRFDFHSLLRDAYEAAGDLTLTTAANQTGIDSTNRLSGDSSVTGSINRLPVRVEPLPKSASVDEFQEEVVIDRYSAIDAGIEPPATATTDTVQVNEVRVEPPAFEFEPPTSPVEFAPFVADDFMATTDYESVVDSPVIEKALPIVESKPVVADVRHLENIADAVYSIGESLRPSGSLSSSTDSILNALRQEVVETVEYETSPVSQPADDCQSANVWESIETPPPSPAADSRPFRYLFSLLRRKQHGLS